MLTNKHSAEAHLLIEARLEHEGVPEVYGGGLTRVLAVVCHCWHQQINTAYWLHRFSVGWLWFRLNDLLLHWSCRIQGSGWLWLPNAGKGRKKISKMEHWNNVTMVKQLFQDTLTHAPGPPHKQVTSTQKYTPTRNLHTHHISKHKPFMHTHTLTHTHTHAHTHTHTKQTHTHLHTHKHAQRHKERELTKCDPTGILFTIFFYLSNSDFSNIFDSTHIYSNKTPWLIYHTTVLNWTITVVFNKAGSQLS